jgi:hypothetical protein
MTTPIDRRIPPTGRDMAATGIVAAAERHESLPAGRIASTLRDSRVEFAAMDSVTFELAPTEARVRVVAVLVVSLALQAVAIFLAPWYIAHVNGESLTVGLLRVPDAPALGTRTNLPHTLALIAMFLAGLRYLFALARLGITALLGRPQVRRGLFRSKLVVAWRSSLNAHITTAILLVLAVYATLDTPQLIVRDTDVVVATSLSHTWGGFALVLGFVIAHVGIYLIARDPLLAAAQCWALPAKIDGVPTRPPSAAPARHERPMIKSPLPPPPTGVTGEPFRSPAAPPGRLDDKIVRPTLPTTTAKVVAGENVDEPSLLR